MAESLQHLQLVRAILDYIGREHREIGYLAVLHDLPGVLRGDKPPRIAGFVPDVYAVNVPSTMTIIGEAKTQRDLETEHSRAQVRAFIEFLSSKDKGVLVIAVPWQAVPRARAIIGNMGRSMKKSSVEFVFLDGLNARGAEGC